MTQTEETEELGADVLIDQFRRVRTKLEAMDKKHDEACKPYKDALGLIKGALKRILDGAGADSVKTEFGTAYKSIKTTIKTTDKSELVRGVLVGVEPSMTPAAFITVVHLVVELLDIKPNKTVAEAYLEDNGEQLPGTEISRYIDINVRK
jgi:hypothetical protein